MVIINSRNLKKGVHIKRTLSLFLSALLCLQPLTVYAYSDVEPIEVEETIDEEITSEYDNVEINEINEIVTEETEVIETENLEKQTVTKEGEVIEKTNDFENIEDEILENTENIEVNESVSENENINTDTNLVEENNNSEITKFDEKELKIKAFIDFVNNLSQEVTEDNVEYVGEQVNIALDMYEELIDLGLDDREDITIIIDLVYEIYQKVLDIEKIHIGTYEYTNYKSTVTLYVGDGEPIGIAMNVGDHYDGNWYIASISLSEVTFGSQYGEHNNEFKIPKPEDIWIGVSSNYATKVTYCTSFSHDVTVGARATLIYTGGSATYTNVINESVPTPTPTIPSGDSATPTSNLWNFVLRYDLNGGSGSFPSQYWGTDNKYTKSHYFNVYSQTPIRDGYIFKGWAQTRNGTIYCQPSGSALVSATNISGYNGGSASLTLYAIWEEIYLNTFVLNYDANGGNSAPPQQRATSANTSYDFTISYPQPLKKGYRFLGWSTFSSATTPTYFGGDSINVSGSTTLYAVWKEQVTLTYDANGGINPPSPQIVDKGETVTIKNQENMTKDGYEFVGWNTNKDATEVDWEPGDGLTLSVNTTLYAIWEEDEVTSYTVIYIDGLNEFSFTNESYSSLSLDDTTPPFSQTPQREGYKFIGWKLISVDSNKDGIQPTVQAEDANVNNTIIYEAQWEEIKYKVSWYDEDEETYLDSNTFKENEEEPTYSQELPTKESDSKYNYVFKEWVKQDTPLNDDDISYVASYTANPKESYYTITHEYYTDGVRDGFVSNSENNAKIDDIISEVDIVRNNVYNENTYKYISITPSTLQIQPMPATNEFVLRYERYSYKVIHRYLNEDGDLDGEVEEVFYALEDDKIDASTKQHPLYNDELYPYKEDSGNLIVSTNKDSNIITITYQKEKQLPKETSYLIKWMDIDENELKSEVRDGFIDEVKTPLEDDYKLYGYTFVETQDNILSISLKEDESENILKLYFEKDKPIASEEPIVSESPSPSPSNKPVESEKPSESPKPSDSPRPSESPIVSEEPSVSPSTEPSDSPKPSDKPIVSENPSPSPSSKPSDLPKPMESTKPSETPTVSELPKPSNTPTVSDKPSATPTTSTTPKPNVETTPTPSIVPSTVDIPSTEVPKTSVSKKETETTTIKDSNMPLSATPTKTADELDFWIAISISTFGLLLFLYNRKKH